MIDRFHFQNGVYLLLKTNNIYSSQYKKRGQESKADAPGTDYRSLSLGF